jgi:hypothetical protein
MAIGKANEKTNGINNPKAWATIKNDAWPFTSNGSNSRKALPTSSTKVNTSIVMANDAHTWRNRYLCKVFKFYRVNVERMRRIGNSKMR